MVLVGSMDAMPEFLRKFVACFPCVFKGMALVWLLIWSGCASSPEARDEERSDGLSVMGESIRTEDESFDPALMGRRMSVAERTHWQQMMESVSNRLKLLKKEDSRDVTELVDVKKRLSRMLHMAVRHYSGVPQELRQDLLQLNSDIDREILRRRMPEEVEVRTSPRLPAYRRVAPPSLSDDYFMFRWPLDAFEVTSPFGMREDPFTGKQAFHDGIDLAAERGTLVVSPERGKVIAVDYNDRCGKLVAIDHRNGFKTIFCHFDEVLTVPGVEIGKGWPIGLLGTTGRSTGPHVHFKITLENKAVNPERFVETLLPTPEKQHSSSKNWNDGW